MSGREASHHQIKRPPQNQIGVDTTDTTVATCMRLRQGLENTEITHNKNEINADKEENNTK